jgi:hypothetical protein
MLAVPSGDHEQVGYAAWTRLFALLTECSCDTTSDNKHGGVAVRNGLVAKVVAVGLPVKRDSYGCYDTSGFFVSNQATTDWIESFCSTFQGTNVTEGARIAQG